MKPICLGNTTQCSSALRVFLIHTIEAFLGGFTSGCLLGETSVPGRFQVPTFLDSQSKFSQVLERYLDPTHLTIPASKSKRQLAIKTHNFKK